jgi:hypothetical protein
VDLLTEAAGWACIAGPNYATIAFAPDATQDNINAAWEAAVTGRPVDWIETTKGDLDEYPEWTVITVYYKTPIVEDVE